MEDKALFGGNISGRRLRGVKINPIYQGHEPGILEGPPVETQSESALPIGEIQIEVYESLPRSGQKPFRQSRSSPVIPARELTQGGGLDEGGVGASARRSGREAADDVRMSPTVSSAMDVGNIPWTFLKDRSPVQRQPVWGAFWGVDTTATTLQPPPSDHSHPEKTDKQSVFETRTISSSSLFAVRCADDIDVIDDENSNESGSSAKDVGEENGDDKTPATQTTQEGASSAKNETNPTQNQKGPAGENSHTENSQPSSAMEKTYSGASLVSNSYVYSDFVHFAEHNCHHYSASEPIEKLPNKQYPIQGGNGLSLRGAFPLVKNHKCTCLCHSRRNFQDSGSVLPVTDLTAIGKTFNQIAENGEINSKTLNQKGYCPSKSTPDLNCVLKDKSGRSALCGKAESLPDIKVAPHLATSLAHCERGSVSILNSENNNNYSVVFRNTTDSSSQISEHLGDEISDDVFSDDSPEITYKAACSQNIEIESKAETVTDGNGDCLSRDLSNSNSRVGVNDLDKCDKCDIGNRKCKLCGCPLDSTREQLTSVCEVSTLQYTGNSQSPNDLMSSQTGTVEDVTSLLNSESILLRADELNAPAYLQRYLVEAQKHFLQQQQDLYRRSGHDPPPPTDSSSSAALPIADNTATIPPELLQFLVAEENFVPESILTNGDSVSVVEELNSKSTKSTGWKKSFKSSGSGNSKATSKPSSKANSRQSSRNSKTGKHSSIEDLDAEDEGWLEGVGSLWGGSSSNCSNSIVDRNENLKKAGLSIIHIEGTSTDPGFEMIVPYDGADEEDGNYSSRRRRQRREEMAEQSSWKGEKASMRERLLKAGLCTLIFGILVGIFIGVVVHFSKDAKADTSASYDDGLLSHGSFHGFKR